MNLRFNIPTTNRMSFNDIKIEEYTDRSIVVNGETRKYKEDLKKLGGKYNGNLKNGPGWVFPKSAENSVKTFIKEGSHPSKAFLHPTQVGIFSLLKHSTACCKILVQI